MAQTVDRDAGSRAKEHPEGEDPDFLVISESELEAAKADPRKRQFAAFARDYWRKARQAQDSD